MTDSQSSKTGGTSWELSEAIRLMGEAQASGDPEQIATAMRRHAEALSNSASDTLIPTLKTVLESVVRAEIGKVNDRLDNHNRAELDWRTEERTRRDHQSDYLYKELDELKSLAVEGQTDIKKLSGQVGDMGLALAATIGRVSNVEEVVDGHTLQLSQHEQAIKETRAEVLTLRSQIRVIEQKIIALDQQNVMIRKLLIANPQPDALKKNPDAG